VAALAGTVLIAANLSPFLWDPPRDIPNHVTRADSGALVFTGPSQARTAGYAGWWDEAASEGSFQISLEVTPASGQLAGPARILAVSNSVLAADLMVGQESDHLVIRIRQPGRDDSGNPAVDLPGVLAAGRSTAVLVDVRDSVLSVNVNGETRVQEPLPPDPFAEWEPYPLALGNEPRGSRPWEGVITRATVTTSAGTIDYLQPGALQIPDEYRYVTHRPWEPFLMPEGRDAAASAVHMLGFIVLGAALAMAAHRRWLLLVLLLPAFSVALQLAKIGFAERHPSMVHVVVETIGGILGIALGRAAARRVIQP
jgi:hypothetical protein